MEKENSEIAHREMYSQPGSLSVTNGSLDGTYEVLQQVFAEKYDEPIFTEYGTSLYLAQAVAHAFPTYNAVSAKTMCRSELHYFPENCVKDRKALAPSITGKSHITEAWMTIDKVRSFLGVKTFAITCDRDSALYNDHVALSPDTTGDNVIMTRSLISMVHLAAVIAIYAGGRKDEIEAMAGYAANVQDALKKMDDMVKKIVAEYEHLKLYITLGQGVFHGVANECANKMKEMGLTNSEAYYALGYRHGPMSPVDEDTLVFLLGSGHTADGDGKLLVEMRSYGVIAAAISNHVSTDFADVDYTLDLPCGYNDVQNAVLIGFTGQFMGYYIAEKKGLNVDASRHLSQAIVIKQKKI